MPLSNIDEAFIENLENFTKSLEQVVELMKQQAEKGDTVNRLLSSMEGAKLEDVATNMKEIIESNQKILKNTDEILKAIKDSKKQKDKGLFDKIETKDNKKKIVDGIQTIILIAGGVLAIGLAFKIVGKVDFNSVIALSVGMIAVSYAFSEMAKIKDLTIGKVGVVSLALIGMSIALVISSKILKGFQPMDKEKMFSFVLVSAALGASSYFMFKAVQNLKLKLTDIPKYLMLPIILPAIALGIVSSSAYFKNMQSVGLMQGVSAVFVGIALAVGAFAISMVLKNLRDEDGNIDEKGIGLSLLLIPGIALGIVASSVIFQAFVPLKNPLLVAFSSLAMGVAMIAFLPAVFVFGKLKMSIIETENVIYGILLTAGAIALSSWIFQFGKYDKYPSLKWSAGVGLSLVTFSFSVMIIGKLDKKQIEQGIIGTMIVAGAIMVASWILSLGSYEKYPSLSWAAGVGLSLISFVPAIIVLGLIAKTGMGAAILGLGALMTIGVAITIVAVSHVLGLGDYDTYPSVEWAKGVGLSMIILVPALLILGVVGPLVLFGSFVAVIIAATIVAISDILGGSNYDKYPSLKWVGGVGLTYTMLVPAFMLLAYIGPILIIGSLVAVYIAKTIVKVAELLGGATYSDKPSKEWMSNIGKSLVNFATITKDISVIDLLKNRLFVTDIAKSMVDVANILSKGNFSGGISDGWVSNLEKLFNIVEKVPDKSKLKQLQEFVDVLKDFGKAADKIKDSGIDKLSKLTASVTIMSVIDDQRLQSVIRVLDNNKDNLSNIIEDGGMTKANTTRQIPIEMEKSGIFGGGTGEDKQDIIIKKFDTIIEKFDKVLEYVIQDQGPNNTGKNDSTKR